VELEFIVDVTPHASSAPPGEADEAAQAARIGHVGVPTLRRFRAR
jgi:hypothetical protein